MTETYNEPGMVTWRQWGGGIDAEAICQMRAACSLPVAVAGALMPDAHVGYGLPIGGVLAVQDAVIPYAVGMDIACRMRLSVLDLPVSYLDGARDKLRHALETETCFGVGCEWPKRRSHAVMDADWGVSPVTRRFHDRAWAQLGTSGGGNHFVEFGELTVLDASVGIAAGSYVALLSHGGSRGTGGEVCTHYSRVASSLHPELSKAFQHLGWLPLSTGEGREYWEAMQLMGRYAAANHELIHAGIARRLKLDVLLAVENHHNFAWRERLPDGRNVILHRKGATPAHAGAVGVVPGSMATPGFVVRGKGCGEALNSCAHGAGRRLSRSATRQSTTWSQARKFLAERGVELISAGLDEVPMGYKDIHQVMQAQADLVDILARFDPRIVKMAPEGRAVTGR
jgi:tRNA-splicing ligase RtcB